MVKVESHTSSNQIQSKMSHIGRNVRCALKRALYEKRIVVGVAAAVKQLLNRSTSVESDTSECSDVSRSSDDIIFCVMAPPAAGDSATHMQNILLEAFCYENDIYIVKVDSATKLSRLLGSRTTQTCALIQRPWSDGATSSSSGSESWDESELSAAEAAIVDHCEEFWDVPMPPLVQLPDWIDKPSCAQAALEMVEKPKKMQPRTYSTTLPFDWMMQHVIDNQAPRSGPTTPTGMPLPLTSRERNMMGRHSSLTTSTTKNKCLCPLLLANRQKTTLLFHSNTKHNVIKPNVYNSHNHVTRHTTHAKRRCQFGPIRSRTLKHTEQYYYHSLLFVLQRVFVFTVCLTPGNNNY